MNAGLHLICQHRSIQGIGHVLPAHAYVESQDPGSFEEPVKVAVQSEEPPVVEANPLPDSVAQAEATVEDGYLRPISRDKVLQIFGALGKQKQRKRKRKQSDGNSDQPNLFG